MRWKLYTEVFKTNDSHARFTYVSERGYAVMRCTVEGVPIQRYIAFRIFPGSNTREVLGGYGSLKEAQTACEAHQAQSREVA